MSLRSPSIQSFFEPQRASAEPNRCMTSPTAAGDGFTGDEGSIGGHVANGPQWKPRQAYEDFKIGDLVAGPRAVTLTGRIVNVYEQQQLSKKPKAAKGLIRLILRDDTGALVVSLVSTERGKPPSELTLSLGQALLCRHSISAKPRPVVQGLDATCVHQRRAIRHAVDFALRLYLSRERSLLLLSGAG